MGLGVSGHAATHETVTAYPHPYRVNNSQSRRFSYSLLGRYTASAGALALANLRRAVEIHSLQSLRQLELSSLWVPPHW